MHDELLADTRGLIASCACELGARPVWVRSATSGRVRRRLPSTILERCERLVPSADLAARLRAALTGAQPRAATGPPVVGSIRGSRTNGRRVRWAVRSSSASRARASPSTGSVARRYRRWSRRWTCRRPISCRACLAHSRAARSQTVKRRCALDRRIARCSFSTSKRLDWRVERGLTLSSSASAGSITAISTCASCCSRFRSRAAAARSRGARAERRLRYRLLQRPVVRCAAHRDPLAVPSHGGAIRRRASPRPATSGAASLVEGPKAVRSTTLERRAAGPSSVWTTCLAPRFPRGTSQYLRTGDAMLLDPVLDHNRMDLVSLAGLTMRLAWLYQVGPDASRDGGECFGLGRLFERTGLVDRAQASYQRASSLARHFEDDLRLDALAPPGAPAETPPAPRRRVRDVGEDCRANRGSPSAARRDALRALSVHHEHRLKDLTSARTFTLQSVRAEQRPRSRGRPAPARTVASQARGPRRHQKATPASRARCRICWIRPGAEASWLVDGNARRRVRPTPASWSALSRPCGAASHRLRAELLREPLDTAFRVDELLAAGEEGVARRTDFQVQLLLGRAGLPGRAARTTRVHVEVLRMNAGLHGAVPFLIRKL